MKDLILLLLITISLSSCSDKNKNTIFTNAEKTMTVNFGLTDNKSPFYQVYFHNKLIINTSDLGIIREDADFFNSLQVLQISNAKPIEESYTMLQGKQKEIIYKANEYSITLKNPDGKLMDIIIRLSDDGIAFRYHFPETDQNVKKILEEKTTYNFIENATGWLQPMSKAKTGYKETNPSYEEHYNMDIPIKTKSTIGEGWVYPALFRTDCTWTLISETGLNSNYCGTRLKYNDSTKALQVTFPQIEEVFHGGNLNPESSLPWSTPWRIITIGSLQTITESTLGTDLASPAIDTDTSYIKTGLSSWSWVLLKDDYTNYETTLKFIDYASNMNWSYCLVDADWDKKIGFDKMTQLSSYAQSKGVKLLLWYNSSGNWNSTVYTPKSKLLTHSDRETQFKILQEMGIAGVKIDFFGGDGQSMIAYYHDILKDAAKYKLLVNFHGATLPRGLQRTYPNFMTTEAIKGQEFITFFQEIADLQPSHCAMIPFARNVFDPMDFTPMVLDSIPNIQRRTTKTFELALPVLFLSGIHHIAEIPSGMAKQPDYITQYLKDIPINWDSSKFITGYPGKEIIVARKKSESWYIVGINGENKNKEFEIDLSFISQKNGFIIKDGIHGFEKDSISISENSPINIEMKPFGGVVMKF